MGTVYLSKPITAHGENTEVLNLREPTIKDLKKHGHPYTLIAASGQVDVHPDRILAWAATLAGVNPASLDGLAFADYPLVESAVMDFFGGAANSETPLIASST